IELPRNRAELQFEISEGRTGQIKKINFTGNENISDSKLLRQMRVRESGLRTIFSSGDRYDPYTIQEELDQVQQYYRNNGYLKAEVNYSSATISPNQDTIYLDIDIHEGKKYHFGDFTVVGNYPSVDKEELLSLVDIKPGSLYRAKTVEATVKALQDRLGNEGYAQARVNAIPR
ncbi:outer membrane protein assembly factor BamA, partial [Tsukamurella sputi]